MSEHDDDIDFDFFGEPEPEPPRRRLVRRPGGSPPGGPPPPRRPGAPAASATPVVRLVSLIVFAIAMILILVFAVRSCESSNQSAAYKNYMGKVATIATDSDSVGTQLSTLLANQSLTEAKLETKLQGLIEQQNIDISKASKLTPPGPLRQAQAQMVEALQLQSNGLSGLLAVFKATASKRGSTEVMKSGVLLSQQMYKIVAGDVIWADMFVSPARKVLQKQGIAGVSPPTLVFLDDPTQATRNSMGSFWQQIHGIQSSSTSTTTGKHGTGISYVKVFPSNQTLTEGVTKTIQIKSNLTFVVGVQNTGDYLEQNVKVTLVIHQNAPYKSITQSKVIPEIYNGATQEVEFRGPFNLGTMISVVPINVDVHPVTGEANLSNNSATYEVRFSF